jgi:phosphoribosylformylglycinamidine synthase
MGESENSSFMGTIKMRDLDHSGLSLLSSEMGIGLNLEEMIRLRNYFQSLGRDPTETELQAMGQAWSEHCCYKSSKFYLKKYLSNLRTDYTVLAMEDDAGVVNIKDDIDYVVKMESHNHPSAVEPYGGAATGVGGILRDILCMGAQPIGVIDSLYLGNGKGSVPKGYLNTLYTVDHIVAGIRDYGNRVGIPTVAGSLYFGEQFEGIPLVNVGCVGITRRNKISRSRVSSTNDILILAGGKTGRDGIHGVNFASRNLESDDKESRRAVQLGNPIVKEPLIHAILEANDLGLIKGMKDLGGGGLSSAAGELCLAGNAGGEIHLDKVILKEKEMEPWEIWISESQERMLIATDEASLIRIRGIFEKWGIIFSIVGKSVPGRRMKLYYTNSIVMDLSLNFLTSGPIYAKPYLSEKKMSYETKLLRDPPSMQEEIISVMKDLNNGGKFPVIRQFDHTVRGDTVLKPFCGNPNRETHSDAPVLRVSDTNFYGLGLSSGSSINASTVDAYGGTIWTLAKSFRNLLCSGCNPHSVVDAMNFGNPDNPIVMGQLVDSLRAIRDFCKFFHLPVVAGNVSLYNNIGNKNIPPTPNILIIGTMEDYRTIKTPDFKQKDNTIYLIGKGPYGLAGSQYSIMRNEQCGTLDGMNLEELDTMKRLIMANQELIKSIHDVSTGGIALALMEMSFGSNIGFKADLSQLSPDRLLNKLFSESGNRFIVEVEKSDENRFEEAFKGVLFKKLGITGGSELTIVNDAQVIFNSDIESLRNKWEIALENLV